MATKNYDGNWKIARLTGYHPRDVRNDKERLREGPDNDSMLGPLRYLEEYVPSDQSSFVGLAADKNTFKRGDKIDISEYPGVRFIIMDNGGGFNGKTGEHAFDIPVYDRIKAEKVTGIIHWRRHMDAPLISSNQPISGDGFIIAIILAILMA